MQFNITGKHLEITPAMHEAIDQMLQELESNHPHITSAQVTLQTQKHEKIAEATLSVAGHSNIHGNARHDDMYVAIDQLKDKLSTQLHKIKEKQETH